MTVADGGIVTYTLNVEGGSGSGVFEAGKSVTITANAPATGKQFTGWTLTGVTVGDKTKAEITFKMPANNVTATANYDFIDYTVSITGGTADKTTAHYGETVTITANAPDTGKQFTGWTLTGVTVGDKTKAEITFKMPANNVTVTAEFEDIDYRVTVTNGTADKTTAHYGDTVTITADEPEKGKEFDKWTVTGLHTAGLDLTKPELTFTMPAQGDGKL